MLILVANLLPASIMQQSIYMTAKTDKLETTFFTKNKKSWSLHA